MARSRFDIEGAAKFVPKGSDLVFELHYTTSGKPASDISKIGLVLAKSDPTKRYFFHAGPTALNLAIPPGEGAAEVVSEITFGEDAQLVYAQPHMHLRGKDFELRVVTPDKAPQTVLKGNFNFEWQMGYQYAEPIAMPKGSKLQLITHFDNSTANRFNPDPAKKVVWGPQNWDEMSNCFIGVLFDKNTEPEKVFLRSGPSMLPRGEAGPTLAAFNQSPDGVAPGDQRQHQRERRRAGDQRRPGLVREIVLTPGPKSGPGLRYRPALHRRAGLAFRPAFIATSPSTSRCRSGTRGDPCRGGD